MAHDHCHCRDYSRSQLLHKAAAQAGKGLPAIETGMPTPAGTGLSRRTFLSRSAGFAWLRQSYRRRVPQRQPPVLREGQLPVSILEAGTVGLFTGRVRVICPAPGTMK